MSPTDGEPNNSEPQKTTGQLNTPLPSIAALFLVIFDNRKGYTLAWQRSVNQLDLEGVVEFKSLPSGLHNVQEDLVYFVHEEYVGVSAFLNTQDDQAERNARMLSAGVLVPLEHGRMGKSWLHAEHLKELCRHIATKNDDYGPLEKYWDQNHIPLPTDSSDAAGSESGMTINIPKKPTGYQLSRSMSVGTVPLTSTHTLSAHHPALALSHLLHLFGPLLLPLYRAALLRKRILFLCEAPVEQACNFVYNISILSSIPRVVAESMSLDSPSDLRIQPLFNVGISDIPLLSTKQSPKQFAGGWVASTTDDVLCTKPELFDLLVRLPGADALRVTPRQYPKLIVSNSELSKAYPKIGLRATLRDAKRYRSLAVGVKSFPPTLSPDAEVAVVETDPNEEVDAASIASSISSGVSRASIVEPQSWGRIAYTSLVWWASAGDKRSGLVGAEENEDEQDLALLGTDTLTSGDDEDQDHEVSGETREVAIVNFFHRLTSLIFEVLGAAVQRSIAEEEERYHDEAGAENEAQESSQNQSSEGDQEPLVQNEDQHNSSIEEAQPVEITPEDVAHMGLDIWNEADRRFIEEMVSFWWGREATILGGKVECCGIRIM